MRGLTTFRRGWGSAGSPPVLGIPVGLSGVSGTGSIRCVNDTVIRVRAFDLINVSIRDALCNVPRSG